MSKDRYFPMFISITGKQFVVYGGGTIAARRVAGLLRFGAKVRVIAPKLSEELVQLQERYKEQLILCRESYCPGIPDADYVLSCVDDRAVDEQIWRECREKKIPVNIASDQTKCDFFFPALVEQGDMVIGICSGGADHSAVRRLAQKIREVLTWNRSE